MRRVKAKRRAGRKLYKAFARYMEENEKWGISAFETGAGAATWNEECMQGVLRRYFQVHLDQCAYRCVHPKSGLPVQKKTKIICSHPIIMQMERRCACKVQHDQAKGGSSVTAPLAFYPKQMCMKLASLIVPYKDKVNKHEHTIKMINEVLADFDGDDFSWAEGDGDNMDQSQGENEPNTEQEREVPQHTTSRSTWRS